MRLLRIIKRCWRSLKRNYNGKRHKSIKQTFILKHVRDFPDEPEDRVLYALGKPGNELFAGMKCPCGCQDFIELVLNGHSPSWKISVSRNDKPSLYPSVFRSVKCRSHFFLIKGKIKWCNSYFI